MCNELKCAIQSTVDLINININRDVQEECANRFLEVSWRRCHSSSGFSLSQFVRFLHVIPDRLDDDEIRSLQHWLLPDSVCKQNSHWITKMNGKMNVWKCKLIFPTDTLQHNIEITDLKPYFSW